MKKLLSLSLAIVLTIFAAWAKESANVTTKVFKADVTCQNCADKIMNNVPSLGKGVKDVKVDVAQKTVTVTYDAAKNTPANIIKGLASLSVAASEATDASASATTAKQDCAKIKVSCCKRASEAKVSDDCCKAQAQAAQAAAHTECPEMVTECKVARNTEDCHKATSATACEAKNAAACDHGKADACKANKTDCKAAGTKKCTGCTNAQKQKQ